MPTDCTRWVHIIVSLPVVCFDYPKVLRRMTYRIGYRRSDQVNLRTVVYEFASGLSTADAPCRACCPDCGAASTRAALARLFLSLLPIPVIFWAIVAADPFFERLPKTNTDALCGLRRE